MVEVGGSNPPGPTNLPLDSALNRVVLANSGVLGAMPNGSDLDLSKALEPFTRQGVTVEIAAQDKVTLLLNDVQRVLQALGYEDAFVTDLSMIADFPLDDDELAHVSAELGVPVTRNDYIYEVAFRMVGVRTDKRE